MKRSSKFFIVIAVIVAVGFVVIFALASSIGIFPEGSTAAEDTTNQGDMVLRNDPYITFVPNGNAAAETLTYSEPVQSVYSPEFGPQDAPVELFVYSDFECPACQAFSAELSTVLEQYTGRIHLVWKDFPIPRLHPNAMEAAEAARCAKDQGKYWEMHDNLFVNQATLGDELYNQLATTIGLDATAFSQCRESDKYIRFIQQDYIEGSALGVSGTPTLFINGQKYTGELTSGALIVTIEEKLNGTTKKN